MSEQIILDENSLVFQMSKLIEQVKQLEYKVEKLSQALDTKFITKEEFETYKTFFWITVGSSVTSVISAIFMFLMSRK